LQAVQPKVLELLGEDGGFDVVKFDEIIKLSLLPQ
jgi:hypothetical protein